MGGSLPDALASLASSPHDVGIFVDFDGTISEIVDDPGAARPLPGAAAALDGLATTFGRVAVLSGRPVDFLTPWFGPDVMLSGLYGLETIVHGRRLDHPLGGVWREVVDDVALQSASRGPDGMRVESKGLSLTLHYRGRPEREAARRPPDAGGQAAASVVLGGLAGRALRALGVGGFVAHRRSFASDDALNRVTRKDGGDECP